MRAFIAAVSLGLYITTGAMQAKAQTSGEMETMIPVGAGAQMEAPQSWQVARQSGVVRFDAPERDFKVAIVGVIAARNAADAVVQAWRVSDATFKWPLRLSEALPAHDGWDEAVQVTYEVPPAEKAIAQALALRRGTAWTVVTLQGALATIAKRGGQLAASTDTLRPIGYVKESFSNKAARRMDATRIEALKNFVRTSMASLKIPGVGLAVVDDDRIVYEGGIGVKDVASGAPVGKDTLFMVASNTKGMSTLLLATLVDQGKLDWNKPVVDYLPTFRLGSEEITRKVFVKHLVCACTGMPRLDMQLIFNSGPNTGPEATFAQLASTQPTSGFGEVYQYNNLMASAAGYLAAHVLYPDMELGAAFGRAMRERVFDPLNMKATTFSRTAATQGDWAKPYDTDVSGRIAAVDMALNDGVIPYLPSGGAWSSAHDMALYVRNELDEGRPLNGTRLFSPKNLLARRVHNVPTGKDVWYGMGLEDDASKGVSVLQHGGSLFGYKSNWFAVPAAKVGVVVLTNSDRGYALADGVKRRLLELLYDGKPQAAEDVTSAAKRAEDDLTKLRSEVDLHAAPERAEIYLGKYVSDELGPLSIGYEGGKLTARATSVWSEVAAKRNQDGSTSLITISPGFVGIDLLVTQRDAKRALVLSEGQHEYVFKHAAQVRPKITGIRSRCPAPSAKPDG